jgi:hypothetical protein
MRTTTAIRSDVRLSLTSPGADNGDHQTFFCAYPFAWNSLPLSPGPTVWPVQPSFNSRRR